MKVKFAWMGVDSATGGQAFGNSTFTLKGPYRRTDVLDRVSAEIQRLNHLAAPATIMGYIELDQEPS